MEIGESRRITHKHRAYFPGCYPHNLRRVTCLYVLEDQTLHDWSASMFKWCEQEGPWRLEW